MKKIMMLLIFCIPIFFISCADSPFSGTIVETQTITLRSERNLTITIKLEKDASVVLGTIAPYASKSFTVKKGDCLRGTSGLWYWDDLCCAEDIESTTINLR